MQGGESLNPGSCQHQDRPQARRVCRMVWRPPPAASGSPAGREFIEKHVKPMSEDLEKKRALFMDDASFISEARSGPTACRDAVSDVTMSAQHTVGG